jgi:hypothetical protein
MNRGISCWASILKKDIAFMLKKQRHANFYFLLATGLISLFAYTLLFSAISLIRGYSISAWQFPVAAVMMLVTQYFAAHELFHTGAKKVFLISSGTLIALILLCLVFANSIYDLSFDGQWYHQETVYRIKTGWNPYHRELPIPLIHNAPDQTAVWCSGPHQPPKQNPNGEQWVPSIKYLSINYFPKGAEIASAAIYALTNRIETGKAINPMLLLASFFLCLSVLYKLDRWDRGKNWLIAFIIGFNPVTIYQLSSYCVDGLMYSVLICMLAIFILIVRDENKYPVFLFGLLIMLAVNIKFTAIIYAGSFCLGFFCWLALKRKWLLVRKILIAGSISLAVGFVFIGFHPYMTNLIAHNNIFQSLSNTREEIYSITPTQIRDKNRFVKFLISQNARTSDQSANDSSLLQTLKMPFTFSKSELMEANNPETKVAGFGPFFSGALLVSLLLLFIMTLRHFKEDDFKTGLFSAGFLLLSIFLIPDPWWARFAPQSWLFPCIILFLSEWISFRGRLIKLVLYGSLLLNILWAFSGILFNILISAHVNYQIAQLKTLSQPIAVEYCEFRDFSGNRIRFYENNIPFIEKNVTGNHIYNVIHSNTRFETAEELPDLPESFFLKLNRKLKGSNAD